ncbi:hypothetical protein CUR178_02523 [Leishmania enriettii]|uniref:Uncharacterized protein n=1 Tax=Leishmania enriettii TaxID=5663 RepID=A0A836GNW5_LEIEN|nr:hypothetical protein CUR178_02523 [Leishmania enriettii]
MSSIYRCDACGRLTAMSLCPRCEVSTEHYVPILKEIHAVTGSGYGAPAAVCTTSTAISLTIADINSLARQSDTVSASAVVSRQTAVTTSRSVAELQGMVASLLQENAELREKLQRNRRQMLRSARDVRDLHASYKLMRQKDLDRMDVLNRESQRLRKVFEMQNHAQELVEAASSRSQSAAAATAPCPLSEDSPCPPKVPVEPETAEEDVAVLHAEVARLRSALALKTQQLDDLWSHAERAENHVQDLLQRLGHVQDIVHEESRYSARLSRRLEHVEKSPEDIVSFIPLRDRSSAAQQIRSRPIT